MYSSHHKPSAIKLELVEVSGQDWNGTSMLPLTHEWTGVLNDTCARELDQFLADPYWSRSCDLLIRPPGVAISRKYFMGPCVDAGAGIVFKFLHARGAFPALLIRKIASPLMLDVQVEHHQDVEHRSTISLHRVAAPGALGARVWSKITSGRETWTVTRLKKEAVPHLTAYDWCTPHQAVLLSRDGNQFNRGNNVVKGIRPQPTRAARKRKAVIVSEDLP